MKTAQLSLPCRGAVDDSVEIVNHPSSPPLSSSGLTYKVDSRLEYLFSINSILNFMPHHYHSVVWWSRLSDSDISNKCKFIILCAELDLSFSRLLVEILSAFRDDWIIIIVIILNFHAHPRQKRGTKRVLLQSVIADPWKITNIFQNSAEDRDILLDGNEWNSLSIDSKSP